MFELVSNYKPCWDQPVAIETMWKFLDEWHKYQTLWWVTWSWKTYMMANMIARQQKPALIVAHNKTLAAQLAQEFKEFFPNNAVHYFVSYYDYYQPEAYNAKTDTYIEKDASINEEIDRLRHAATQDLLSRKDVIIVASVSCIYGIWNIENYLEQVFELKKWEEYTIEDILKQLVRLQYKRAWEDFMPGMFQVLWDIVEIYPASQETVFTIEFWGDEVSQITRRNYLTWEIYEYLKEIIVFPAKHTVTSKETVERIIPNIQKELDIRLKHFEDSKEMVKHERLKTKVEFDIEMLSEVWYVNGIENYSMYIDWRNPWGTPTTLIDYFWDDFITFVDESHMTLSQIGGMFAWDKSRKWNLVEYGFRLPSALENRPLRFEEFEKKVKQIICVSATPWKIDVSKSTDNPEEFIEFDATSWKKWLPNSNKRIVPLLIRPTGLLDPIVEVKDLEYMVDDLMKHIHSVVKKNERMLVTTITIRSSEELTEYLSDNWIKVKYLHSEIDTLERIEILRDLRMGTIDVIVWVNLLREGLDLPEVSTITIIDAEKQWFLRSETALIQIIGRASRNEKGKVIMYTKDKKISPAMEKAIRITKYRRELQEKYNKKNGIIPKTIFSKVKDIWIKSKKKDYVILDLASAEKEIFKLELEMDVAASNMDYERAAEIRDQIIHLKRWEVEVSSSKKLYKKRKRK